MFDRTKDSQRKIVRGMDRLTERMPNWKGKLAPDLIEMKNGYPTEQRLSCILCQLFGSFEAGLVALGIPHSKAPDYGFDVPSVSHWSTYIYGGTRAMFDSLNTGWKRAVLSP